jgi:hypothetical protein
MLLVVRFTGQIILVFISLIFLGWRFFVVIFLLLRMSHLMNILQCLWCTLNAQLASGLIWIFLVIWVTQALFSVLLILLQDIWLRSRNIFVQVKKSLLVNMLL